MSDISAILAPKSDQINADDLTSGRTITVTVRGVTLRGGQEQPVSIALEGNDKFYRPCKSMARVMANAWGRDTSLWAGKAMTLYCDESVKFGPLAVGGIRISHMSHIDGPMTMALTATKGVKKAFVVKPLVLQRAEPAVVAPARQSADDWTNAFIGRVNEAGDLEALAILQNKSQAALAKLDTSEPSLAELARSAISRRLTELSGDGRSDEQMGDLHDRGSDLLAEAAE